MKRMINIMVHIFVGTIGFNLNWLSVHWLEYIFVFSLVISLFLMMWEPIMELVYCIKDTKKNRQRHLEIKEAKHAKKLHKYSINNENIESDLDIIKDKNIDNTQDMNTIEPVLTEGENKDEISIN